MTMPRRSFINLSLTSGLAVLGALASCGGDVRSGSRRPAGARSERTPRDNSSAPVLLAYFSRPGENYYCGGRRYLKVGNTEVLARLINERVDCDLHRILAADPYPTDYEETVQRNVDEQNADARPAIADKLESISRYDTILLASPIWNVQPPKIMSTFADSYDFSKKTVLPITTHAMSGLGTAERDYVRLCAGARVGPGLAVRGEEVRSSGDAIEAWIARTGLARSARDPQ